MPINFLGNIKLSESFNTELLDPLTVPDLFFKSEHILGAYVFSCKDLARSQPLFNDGNPCLIFLPNKTDVVHLTKAKELIKLNAAWVCCGIIQNTHWQLPIDLPYIIVLRFKQSSFYQIFDIEPNFFLNKPYCNFSDMMSKHWTEFLNQLYENKTLVEQMHFLKNIFSTYKIVKDHPYLLRSALEKINNKKGNITVSSLIIELGGRVNRKWLQRNFTKYIGISPKKYISLQRFIFIYGNCKKNHSNDVLPDYFSAGYYDYNHFLKEFKQNIGVSPTKYNWS